MILKEIEYGLLKYLLLGNINGKRNTEDLLLVERTVTHTVLGRSELKNKIKEKEELAKETKTMTTLEGIKSEIRILENELKNIIVSKSHKILGRGDIQRRIDRKKLVKEVKIATYFEFFSTVF